MAVLTTLLLTLQCTLREQTWKCTIPDISSNTVDGVNHWYAYVDQGSTLYVVESTYTSGGSTVDCADNANGKTGNCPIFVGTGIGTFAADAFYGGYANAIAYRLVAGTLWYNLV